MSDYVPELGQMAFGQPWKQYAVSELGQAALRSIAEEFDRVQWNINQEETPNPFDNSGARFECPTFKAHAYSWNDEEEQPWNFKWGDIEISWYKWSGRGTSSNVELTPQLISNMLDACLQGLRDYENSVKG